MLDANPTSLKRVHNVLHEPFLSLYETVLHLREKDVKNSETLLVKPRSFIFSHVGFNDFML